MSVSTIYTGSGQDVRVNGSVSAPSIVAQSAVANKSVVSLSVLPTPLPPAGAGILSLFELSAGTGPSGGAANCLNLFSFANGVNIGQLLSSTPATAAAAPATPLLLNLVGPQQSGTATIALGASTVVVPLAVSANPIIMLTQTGALDATATKFRIASVVAGTSFTIAAEANATAAVEVDYFVVKL
jgi:hypothetical protein